MKEVLLPSAVGFWERALSVRRSSAPIRLHRKCRSSQYYLHPGAERQSCAGDCKNVTKCGEVAVPEHHLLVSPPLVRPRVPISNQRVSVAL